MCEQSQIEGGVAGVRDLGVEQYRSARAHNTLPGCVGVHERAGGADSARTARRRSRRRGRRARSTRRARASGSGKSFGAKGARRCVAVEAAHAVVREAPASGRRRSSPRTGAEARDARRPRRRPPRRSARDLAEILEDQDCAASSGAAGGRRARHRARGQHRSSAPRDDPLGRRLMFRKRSRPGPRLLHDERAIARARAVDVAVAGRLDRRALGPIEEPALAQEGRERRVVEALRVQAPDPTAG
jgi:hypothetical protein